jgi:hypothetical protein
MVRLTNISQTSFAMNADMGIVWTVLTVASSGHELVIFTIFRDASSERLVRMRMVITRLTNSKNVVDASGVTFILYTAFSLWMEIVLTGDALAKCAEILGGGITGISDTNSGCFISIGVVFTSLTISSNVNDLSVDIA